MYVSSKLVLFVTVVFHCCVFERTLDAKTLFMSMAMLNNVQFTMTQLLPRVVSLGVESLVSLRRITEFLLAPEFAPSHRLKLLSSTRGKNDEFKLASLATIDNANQRRHSGATDDRCSQDGESQSTTTTSITSDNNKRSRAIKHALVECCDVSARWPASDTKTLHNVTFRIESPGLLVVCGQVASGKSSLFLALLNELPISDGCAKIQGTYGYCSQTAWIFNGTPRDNIVFGQDFDAERYAQVVEACALKRDFDYFDCGDLTYIQEESLSGGQKARINLARCLYRDSDVYLLDDPFSAIDNNVSAHIFEHAIKSFLAKKLVLMTTHQVKLIRRADQVLLLDAGEQLFYGPYDELSAKLRNPTDSCDKLNKEQLERLSFLIDQKEEKVTENIATQEAPEKRVDEYRQPVGTAPEMPAAREQTAAPTKEAPRAVSLINAEKPLPTTLTPTNLTISKPNKCNLFNKKKFAHMHSAVLADSERCTRRKPADEEASSSRLPGLRVWYEYYTQTSIFRLILIILTFSITQALFSTIDIYLTVWSLQSQNRLVISEITAFNHNQASNNAHSNLSSNLISYNSSSLYKGYRDESTHSDRNLQYNDDQNRVYKTFQPPKVLHKYHAEAQRSTAAQNAARRPAPFRPRVIAISVLAPFRIPTPIKNDEYASPGVQDYADDAELLNAWTRAFDEPQSDATRASSQPTKRVVLAIERRYAGAQSNAHSMRTKTARNQMTRDFNVDQSVDGLDADRDGNVAPNNNNDADYETNAPQPVAIATRPALVDAHINAESGEALNVKPIYRPLYLLVGEFTSGQHVVVYTLLLIALFASSAITNILSLTSSNKSAIALYRKLTDNALFARLSFFDQNPIGRLLNRATRDIGIIDEAIPYNANQAYDALLQTAATFLIVALVDITLALPSLIILLIFLIFHSIHVKPTRDIQRLEGISRSPIITHIGTTLSGLHTIRATKSEMRFEQTFVSYQDEHTSIFLLYLGCNRSMAVVLDSLNATYTALIALYAVVSGISGPSAGLIITSAMLLSGLTQHGVMKLTETESLMTSVERVIEYCNLPQEDDYDSKWKAKLDCVSKRCKRNFCNCAITLPASKWRAARRSRCASPKSVLCAPQCHNAAATGQQQQQQQQQADALSATRKSSLVSASSSLTCGSSSQASSSASSDLSTATSAAWPNAGCIEYRQVDLYYNRLEKPVLRNISFTLTSGEKVGIIGRTGAGKSSIITTLFRLYDYDGTISIDGVDIRSLDLIVLRSAIGIIPQHPVLFSTTIRKNLDPFNVYDDMALWSALDKAHLRKTVSSLPGKLDYNIGSGACVHSTRADAASKGNRLSGNGDGGDDKAQPHVGGGGGFSLGQKQLICLARVLLRQNRIIVMDEATANVDPNTDAIIQTTIRHEFKRSTVITIAHRLETILDCDRIMVLDAGRIVDFDTPERLASKNGGHIAELLEQQKRLKQHAKQP